MVSTRDGVGARAEVGRLARLGREEAVAPAPAGGRLGVAGRLRRLRLEGQRIRDYVAVLEIPVVVVLALERIPVAPRLAQLAAVPEHACRALQNYYVPKKFEDNLCDQKILMTSWS